jgi:putative N6-adenine-specific DNA methylase
MHRKPRKTLATPGEDALEQKNWFAVTAPGLEPVVARELETLGIEGRQETGGIAFQAALFQGAVLSCSMRTPTKLLLRLASGPATQLQHIGSLIDSVGWRTLLPQGTQVSLRVSSHQSRLHRQDLLKRKSERVLKAILRGSSRETPSTQGVLLRLEDNQATLSIDAGGELLHRRGWRKEQARASLRENWAASLLVMAGWNGDEALLDPFCGSGTIPIEAARLASGLPPWTERDFAWKSWLPLAGLEPRKTRQAPLPCPIVGTDHHAPSIGMARRNAERAEAKISFDVREVLDAGQAVEKTGLIATNPPYGARLGRRVEGVYEDLGELLETTLPSWRAIFLAPRDALAARVSSTAQRITQFSNGGKRVGVYIAHEIEAPEE